MNIDHTLCEYNIFLTGASGFIGTVLLQRLLRIENSEKCTIFCLLRSGRAATVTERLRNEILKAEIFEFSDADIDALICQRRVVALEGELTEECLGLDAKSIAQLKHSHERNGKKGTAVIHCAADIDFNRELNASMHMNAYGTYECMAVAKEIDAHCFIHISTLYVNAREHCDKRIDEAIYDCGLDCVAVFDEWMQLRRRRRHDDDGGGDGGGGFDRARIAQLQSATSRTDATQRALWPNNYTFTKHVTEHVVRHYCAVPHAIVRLGIVSPVCKGPHLGWFMGNGGFVFLVIGIATGNIKYLRGDGRGRPDFVPVDYTCDTICGVTAATLLRGSGSSGDSDGTIYQCGVIANDPVFDVRSSVQHAKPIFLGLNLPYVQRNAGIHFIENKFLFFAIEFLLYELPLWLLSLVSCVASTLCSWYWWVKLYYHVLDLPYDIDFLSTSSKKKNSELTLAGQIRSLQLILFDKPYAFVKRVRFMQRARDKLNWFNANYTYFVNQRWCFTHDNVKALYATLDETSQRKYNFDVNSIEFNKYACDAALVCFKKYIGYRDTKKQSQTRYEEELRKQLQVLRQEYTARKQRGEDEPEHQDECHHHDSLTQAEKIYIFNILRKIFFMFDVDIKLSICVVIGMITLAIVSFFVLGP
eukprot:CAMPEP_0202685418 /NCGR_PEP_ID=MMETSP1385-20130828/1173_1 /ASSEMBLY_ACC=CAM_ASM_000861 /TAXON_ID=933848 /ORGANISM="Elphidium margaritaceum" /LENGTH=643 /DNA_ID=CAMNT_0049339757 /DNA_START=26 /DNA_END=1957 /DNA_ORIENTATION=+